MKHLLIVYHSKTGNTAQLARAVRRGARHPDIDAVEVRLRRAHRAGPDDLRWADGLLLGTPENFGYMSGALKDFLDRTYYEVREEIPPLPYAIFISCENDGRGAVAAIERIAAGYPFSPVADPLICRGPVTARCLQQAEELGMTLAAGLDAGVF